MFLLVLAILMLMRYSIASISYEPLGLYTSEIELIVGKTLRMVAVIGSSAFSFFLPGVLTLITGILVVIGKRAKGFFTASIVTTILFPSTGRLMDCVFATLPTGQIQFTTWLLVGGLAMLVAGNSLVGREHGRVALSKGGNSFGRQ